MPKFKHITDKATGKIVYINLDHVVMVRPDPSNPNGASHIILTGATVVVVDLAVDGVISLFDS